MVSEMKAQLRKKSLLADAEARYRDLAMAWSQAIVIAAAFVHRLALARHPALWTVVTAAAVFSASLHAAGMSEGMASAFPTIAQAAQLTEPPVASAHNKLDSQIVLALKQSRGEPPFDKRTAIEPDIPVKDGQNVLLDLDATVSEELLRHIEFIGGRLAPSPDAAHIVRAMIPLAQVETLAGRADVNFISPTTLYHTSRVLTVPHPQSPISTAKP